MDHANTETVAQPQRAGWPLRDWLKAAGFGQTKFFELEGEDAPARARIGKKIIIIEAPDAYLRRIAARQAGIEQQEAA